MDSFETSLGVPGAKIIDPIHDRQQLNQQRHRKRKQKAANKKTDKADLQDSVTLSVSETGERSVAEKTTDKQSHRGKGDFIDIQA